MTRARRTLLSALAAAAIAPLAAHAATISGTYFEDTGSTTCNSQSTCVLLLPVLPTVLNEQFLNLTEVSCTLTSTGVLDAAQIAITDNGGNARRKHHLTVANRNGRQSFLSLLDYKVAGGPPRQISITFFPANSATINADCTVVGRISST